MICTEASLPNASACAFYSTDLLIFNIQVVALSSRMITEQQMAKVVTTGLQNSEILYIYHYLFWDIFNRITIKTATKRLKD